MQPNPSLEARLRAFAFDEPTAALPFSLRLARENGWSQRFTRAVLDEYRRFLYLACTAGHPVTPSDAVDQAWHLHLCYSRSYWDELCGAVLGRPLHHGPTAGGGAESRKYRDWYAATLASYERAFGAAPPAAIWPAPARRFAGRFRRVDTNRHIVLSRAAVARAAVLAAGVGLTACTVEFSGCDGVGQLLIFAIVVIWLLIRRATQSPGGSERSTRRNGDDFVGCDAGGDHHGHGHGHDGGHDGGHGCGGDGCGGGGCGGD